jgi:DeoR family transcriptional regulator, ulaG and ulaABCDEF operon transcriptional repressor
MQESERKGTVGSMLMHANERASAILKRLRMTGFLSFRDLDNLLTASPATLRRDLDRLEEQGKLKRVRGGAQLAEAERVSLSGVPFHENAGRNHPQKQAIGRAAAALCRQGEAVIIDGGSTTLEMGPHIESLGLHVLTGSLHIVSALQRQPGTRISVPAGAVFREQNIILSPYDDDGMSGFHASKLFLGAAGVGPRGPMLADALLIQAERRLLERADEIVLLVDSSKFEQIGGHLLCDLSAIDVIVSDAGLAKEYHDMIAAAGVRLIVA